MRKDTSKQIRGCGVNVGTKWLKRWADADKQCAAGAVEHQVATCDAEQPNPTEARPTATDGEHRREPEPTSGEKVEHKTWSHNEALGRLLRRTNAEADLNAKDEAGGGELSDLEHVGAKRLKRTSHQRGARKRGRETRDKDGVDPNRYDGQQAAETSRKHHKTDASLDFGFDDEEGPNQSEGDDWPQDHGNTLDEKAHQQELADGGEGRHSEHEEEGWMHQAEDHHEEQGRQETDLEEVGNRKNDDAMVDSARQMTLIDYLRECSKGSERPGQPRPPPQEEDSQRAAEEKRRRIERATKEAPPRKEATTMRTMPT